MKNNGRETRGEKRNETSGEKKDRERSKSGMKTGKKRRITENYNTTEISA